MKFEQHQSYDRHIIQDLWRKQAKLYLSLVFSEAEKVLIVDKNGNIIEEVKK